MAKRATSNRKRGDMITTEITSVTTDVIKGVIIEKLLPNIIKMFPRDVSTITI